MMLEFRSDSLRLALPMALLLAACGPSGDTTMGGDGPRLEALSFLDDSLTTLPLSDSVRARYEAQLAEAKTAYDHAPTDPDSIIWYGRRLAYLGKFREAIDVYTAGIKLHPDNPWFYRHRGHRYISVREIDHAIDDLEHASGLVRGKPDEVEPDGQPNAMNQPIGTLHSNIAYHLGLAYYLKGEFEKAVEVYRSELANAQNDDRRVSAAHWLYMSLRRLGQEKEAAEAIASFTPDMNVIENQTYHKLIMMYQGVIQPDEVLNVSGGRMSVTDATAAYGIGNWHIYNGRTNEGVKIFRRIMSGGQWGAFGYIAAEVDLAYMK